MLRACSLCASDVGPSDGARAFPGARPCAAAGAPRSADDACSGDASSSQTTAVVTQTNYKYRELPPNKHRQFLMSNTTYHTEFLTLTICHQQISLSAMQST